MLKAHRDVYRYIHDQTVRMINAGLRPEEIADQLTLPDSLQKNFGVRGYYGTVRHNARAVYQHYAGWFDGNPAHLDPLPREQAARRYVELAGGLEKVLAAGQKAFDQGDYRWAAELLDHAVFAEPKSLPARELLARTYEQLGYQAESATWRGFYLTGALELLSGPPEKGIDRAALLDMLASTPIDRFLDAMAASLDGPAAGGKDLRVNLVFSDTGESYVLWLENAVLHHRRAPPDPAAHATLTLTKPFFLQMMVGAAGAKELLLSDEVKVTGSRIDLGRFFALFAKPTGTFAIVAPR
jgi:alkyl sulfatase BDS1-like metallo-beta-lactamase superfamily hydrolase